jgi:hypothetical protein
MGICLCFFLFFKFEKKEGMKMKVWGILVLASLFLGACENGNGSDA